MVTFLEVAVPTFTSPKSTLVGLTTRVDAFEPGEVNDEPLPEAHPAMPAVNPMASSRA